MRTAFVALMLLPACVAPLWAYSPLTHEAVIDAAWDGSIKPLLRARYGDLTPDQLREAHSYAYGGSIIQDMGYYPFGSKLFSDLVHYVRSGDFVVALVREAQNADELAFALGALSHYVADNNGHPVAVNRVVPMDYPKLRVKYGPVVTYEQNPAAHLKTEFGFDVVEVAKGQYAPQVYHDFIGFMVAKDALERAFRDTYSIELKDVVSNEDLALGTFRFSVSTLIPEATKAAWAAKGKDIQQSQPGVTRRKFLYRLSRSSYRKEWGNRYARPGFFARFVAFVFKLIPKVGPFRVLGFKTPSPQAEKLFMMSFDDTLAAYQRVAPGIVGADPELENTNLDTGGPPAPGSYKLADNAYVQLLEKLADKHREPSPELRQAILAYVQGLSVPLSTKAQEGLAIVKGTAGANTKP
jgi:hypothetical protein